MGQGRGKGTTKESGRVGREQNPWEWGGNNGSRKASRVDPESHGVGRGSVRTPEWRKTPGGGATEWAGKSSCLRPPTPLEW